MTIRLDREGHVLVIVIDRPERRNAIDGQHARDLEEAMGVLESDDSLFVGILTGGGGHFSSGADLAARLDGQRVIGQYGFAGVTHRDGSKPLIAAVEGAAVGGGFEMVLACDLVTASTSARFALPEVLRSVLPAAGGAYRLPRVLPERIAREMMLTGLPLSAQRAFEFGLVNRLVPVGEAIVTALELAGQICAAAPLAVRAVRRIALASATLTDDEAMKLTLAEYAELKKTADFREGPRAYVEKREPRWTGR